MPKVSVIIPVYNVEKYIRRCLDSMCNQTFDDFEVLCIDDGSTDSSLEICQEYAKNATRIKVFHQENKGPAAARNLGLDNATGEYIMFCDSDDWYEPEMIQKMFTTIEKENVDLVVCDVNIVLDESNNRNDDIDYPRLGFVGKIDLDNCQQLQTKVKVLLWKKIFKKSLIDQYDIRFPNGYMHDDCLFVRQYVLVSNTAYGLDEKLYNYVYRSGSIMSKALHSGSKDSMDTIYCIEYLLSFVAKLQNISELKLDYVYGSIQSDTLFWQQFLPVDYIETFSKRFVEIFQKIDLPLADQQTYLLIYYAQKNNFKKIYKFFKKRGAVCLHLSFAERIFSIKNVCGKTKKLVTVLGMSFTVKTRGSKNA